MKKPPAFFKKSAKVFGLTATFAALAVIAATAWAETPTKPWVKNKAFDLPAGVPLDTAADKGGICYSCSATGGKVVLAQWPCGGDMGQMVTEVVADNAPPDPAKCIIFFDREGELRLYFGADGIWNEAYKDIVNLWRSRGVMGDDPVLKEFLDQFKPAVRQDTLWGYEAEASCLSCLSQTAAVEADLFAARVTPREGGPSDLVVGVLGEQGALNNPVVVQDDTATPYFDLVRDISGVTHMAAAKMITETRNALAYYSNAGGAWQELVLSDEENVTVQDCKILVDAGGKVHIMYHVRGAQAHNPDYQYLRYYAFDPAQPGGGAWSPVTRGGKYVSAALDGQGRIRALFLDNQDYVAYTEQTAERTFSTSQVEQDILGGGGIGLAVYGNYVEALYSLDSGEVWRAWYAHE